MYSETLKKLIERVDLSESESAAMVDSILSGELTDAQIGAFLAAMATKGETIEEVAGAARAMRRKAHRLQALAPVVVDTCGTGGDSAGTFNISTTTAFVVAGAGLMVAKHGNRSVSSQCGSADVLEQLGVNLALEPEVVEEGMNEIGIGFLFAPKYHGAMRHVMPARKQLGVRCIFNMLGPLTNPAGATCQLLGVFAPQLTEMFAEVLCLLGTRHALVVHGHDGLDEISTSAPTRVSELVDGRVVTRDISADLYFGDFADPADLAGGDAVVNAQIMRNILSGGGTEAQSNVVLINAAGAFVAADKAGDIPEGIELARGVIDSGAALGKLELLIAFTQDNG